MKQPFRCVTTLDITDAVIRHGKGDKRGIVKVPVDVVRAIDAYLEAAGLACEIGISEQREWTRIASSKGISIHADTIQCGSRLPDLDWPHSRARRLPPAS